LRMSVKVLSGRAHRGRLSELNSFGTPAGAGLLDRGGTPPQFRAAGTADRTILHESRRSQQALFSAWRGHSRLHIGASDSSVIQVVLRLDLPPYTY
jgi:hypothetical protein